jgi:capsular polysaccharide transport system permease protein
LKQKFAESIFNSALASLEEARIDARKQRVFLERITAPSLPDRPKYPYRMLSILGIFIIMSMIYKIGRTFVTDTAEHATR